MVARSTHASARRARFQSLCFLFACAMKLSFLGHNFAVDPGIGWGHALQIYPTFLPTDGVSICIEFLCLFKSFWVANPAVRAHPGSSHQKGLSCWLWCLLQSISKVDLKPMLTWTHAASDWFFSSLPHKRDGGICTLVLGLLVLSRGGFSNSVLRKYSVPSWLRLGGGGLL